jgi:hypothetical protein
MIIETDKMLKHNGHKITYIDRPDLSHSDPSMIYLPYRVCEDCYLLFETMDDIKKFQIEIANFFRNPVDPVNFGLEYYSKKKPQSHSFLEENEFSSSNIIPINNSESFKINNDNDSLLYQNYSLDQLSNSTPKKFQRKKSQNTLERKNLYLHRVLIMFTDLFWNEELTLPDKELYMKFNFLGSWYQVKLGKYYKEMDYFNINFFKIFYLVCDETEGFIDYIEKVKQMEIKLGWFELLEHHKNKIDPKILTKEIIIEDLDNCKNLENFVEFASVELSLQGLKYGEKYRNSLNGLLFKREKPHYVGKLRCIIRISKEGRDRQESSKSEVFKNIDVSMYNMRKHHNVKQI